MAEDVSALQRIQQFFGVRSTGISGQTTRSLIEHGELTPPGPPTTVPAEPSSLPVAGPQPSQELLNRVQADRERRAAESLKRVMEQRQREYGR
jgi:hypothetical protein